MRAGVVVFALLLASPVAAEHPFISPSLEKILAQPEDKLDIGLVALTFSKEITPSLDIDRYSKRIDELADKVRALNARFTTPNHMLASLDAVLYQQEGFKFDPTPDYGERHSNYTVDGLLDTKLGSCTSMTALYIAVAQRLGLSPHPVSAPSHIFARYTLHGNLEQPTLNVEPTTGGTVRDEDYIERFRITPRSLQTGAYMRTLSYREYLGIFLFQAGLAMRPSDDPVVRARSNAFMERASKLSPLSSDITAMLAKAYEFEANDAAMRGQKMKSGLYLQKSHDYARRTQQLGYTPMEEVIQ
jgi:hypothetical protein